MSESTILLIIFVFIVAFIIIFTTKIRLHPFIVLLIASMLGGIFSGMPFTRVLQVISEGFGGTLRNIGIVIAFGSIIGYILEKSGGALRMANTIIRIVGEKRSAFAMTLTGFIVSIPVFADSGFIILSPLNRALSKKSKISLAVFAVALRSGLSCGHVFVPPTPGPLAAAAALNADIGLIIILGIIVSIPAMMVGYLWAVKYAVKFKITPKDYDYQDEIAENSVLPGKFKSFLPILIPLVLIALKSIADFPSHPFGTEGFLTFFDFIGHPINALMIGIFLTFLLVPKLNKEVIHDWVGSGLKSAGIIILITGAGGSLGAILRETEIGIVFGNFLSQFHLGIFLPFLIAAMLKLAQGSSTVAIITTSALIAPMLSSIGFDSNLGRALVVLAIGSGATCGSHANDSMFWVVAKLSDMDVPTSFKCQTVGTIFVGTAGIIAIAFISFLLI
ncbi:GntP family permease [candidate division KSB1 bacterium]